MIGEVVGRLAGAGVGPVNRLGRALPEDSFGFAQDRLFDTAATPLRSE